MPGEVENIVESTSPLITRPEILSSEALKPSSLSIAEQIARNKASGTTTPPKRRPGRPPGSGNRTTSGTSSVPTTDADDETKKAELEARRIRALMAKADSKKKKVDDYTTRIVGELNENIMTAFVSMGIPSTILYKNGIAPIPVVSQNYTPIANQLAVKPLQAKAVASFIVDLEYAGEDSLVARAAASATQGNAALAFKGLLAAGAVFMYVKGALDTMNKLGPIIQQYQAMQEAQARQNQQAHTMAHGAG
jgi:hypothetical protein